MKRSKYEDELKPVEMKLTQGKVAFVSIIDYKDIKNLGWYAVNQHGGYWNAACRPTHKNMAYLPRYIATRMGHPSDRITHKDGNRLNCCRTNLIFTPVSNPYIDVNIDVPQGWKGFMLTRESFGAFLETIKDMDNDIITNLIHQIYKHDQSLSVNELMSRLVYSLVFEE